MKPAVTKLIAIFASLSLAILLLIFWIIEVGGLTIPPLIPGLELSAYGILVLTAYIILFILQQKQQLKLDAAASVFELVHASVIISFISQLLFFLIREFWLLKESHDGTVLIILTASSISTIFLAIVAATVACEIKKIKGVWRHLPTIAFFLLFFFLKDYLHDFKW